MAEGKVKDEKVEVKETRVEESKGEEKDTGRSEGEKLSFLLRCSQYTDGLYH